jgi:hypothetical protein
VTSHAAGLHRRFAKSVDIADYVPNAVHCVQHVPGHVLEATDCVQLTIVDIDPSRRLHAGAGTSRPRGSRLPRGSTLVPRVRKRPRRSTSNIASWRQCIAFWTQSGTFSEETAAFSSQSLRSSHLADCVPEPARHVRRGGRLPSGSTQLRRVSDCRSRSTSRTAPLRATHRLQNASACPAETPPRPGHPLDRRLPRPGPPSPRRRPLTRRPKPVSCGIMRHARP